MAEISRATLFGKLNPIMFKAAEGAVTFCKLRGNPHVDLPHWLFQIVNLPDSDLHRIVRHFEVDTARLVRDFQTMLERLPPELRPSRTSPSICPTRSRRAGCTPPSCSANPRCEAAI